MTPTHEEVILNIMGETGLSRYQAAGALRAIQDVMPEVN
jgi:hypothetical protein